MKPRLTMMMGLPRSGKTTTAKTLGAPIVCPDAIRWALHGQAFYADAEPFVWAIAKVMVRALFEAGNLDVVLDACNTTRKRRDEWKSCHWVRDYVVVDTPADTCIARAKDCGRDELLPIIDRMASQWEPLQDDEIEVLR